MCTVAFIPGDNRYQFVSLRDENPLRPTAISPSIQDTGTMRYIAPVDSLASGTWAGINEWGNVIILLNGAQTAHQKQPFYRKSRGLVVTELLQSELPVVDWNLMNLSDIEPFTLVVWSDNHLFELVWDGAEQTKKLMDATLPHIWSSSTLYDIAAKANRAQLFHQWMASGPVIDRLGLWYFFNQYKEPTNGFIINRSPHLKTLSYSFIELLDNKEATFSYQDLLGESITQTTLPIQKAASCCLHYSNQLI